MLNPKVRQKSLPEDFGHNHKWKFCNINQELLNIYKSKAYALLAVELNTNSFINISILRWKNIIPLFGDALKYD
jgi:hypothetical protein